MGDQIPVGEPRRRVDDARVTYTVKELLAQIKEQQTRAFAELGTSLNQKADKQDLARMEVRLENHATRIASLEETRREAQTVANTDAKHVERTWSRRQRILATVLGIVGVLTPIIGAYVGTHL